MRVSKESLLKEIIEKRIFVVVNSLDKKKWVLLKNGSRTPIFLDTSKFISYPKLLLKLNQLLIQEIKEKNICFDKIVGLPYGGLPFAYGIAHILKTPCLALRKEGKKKYGI